MRRIDMNPYQRMCAQLRDLAGKRIKDVFLSESGDGTHIYGINLMCDDGVKVEIAGLGMTDLDIWMHDPSMDALERAIDEAQKIELERCLGE